MVTLRFLGTVCVVVMVGCGNTVIDGQGGGGATSTSSAEPSSSSSTGTLGSCPSDVACDTDSCIDITKGGVVACKNAPSPSSSCGTSNPGGCCSAADCVDDPSQPGGQCYQAAQLGCVAGFDDQNRCLADGCTSDDDCITDSGTPTVCLPAGVFGYPTRRCAAAWCTADSDCTAGSGGRCKPIVDPCCSLATIGLACTYPGGCTQPKDCNPDGSLACHIVEGVGTCDTSPFGCAL